MITQIQRNAVRFAEAIGGSDVKLFGANYSAASGFASAKQMGAGAVQTLISDGAKLLAKEGLQSWYAYQDGYIQITKINGGFGFDLYADIAAAKENNPNNVLIAKFSTNCK